MQPSCSKRHAVFRYRLVEHTGADGTAGQRVKPYTTDLGSGNGTFLNHQRIEPQRYHELKEKGVLKFGLSSREYVLLQESSDTSELDKKEDTVTACLCMFIQMLPLFSLLETHYTDFVGGALLWPRDVCMYLKEVV